MNLAWLNEMVTIEIRGGGAEGRSEEIIVGVVAGGGLDLVQAQWLWKRLWIIAFQGLGALRTLRCVAVTSNAKTFKSDRAGRDRLTSGLTPLVQTSGCAGVESWIPRFSQGLS